MPDDRKVIRRPSTIAIVIVRSSLRNPNDLLSIRCALLCNDAHPPLPPKVPKRLLDLQSPPRQMRRIRPTMRAVQGQGSRMPVRRRRRRQQFSASRLDTNKLISYRIDHERPIATIIGSQLLAECPTSVPSRPTAFGTAAHESLVGRDVQELLYPWRRR